MAIVTVINNDVLVSVEKATYENMQCIKLNFQKSNSKYKNLEVFEVNNMDQVFVDTKKLIGQNVTVTCWDPPNAPGMWSNNNWFKEITLVKNNTDTLNIMDKGPCIKCGVYDHFVCFSKDFGKTWMHYACKDK
jgi:hypothetical protein